MALGRGGFENQFSGINSYSSVRKPQDLSPGGTSRNSVGSGFGNNIDGSKIGFFGAIKKDGENPDSDFFYGGKSLLQRGSTSTDSGLPNMSNLSLYGSNNSLNSGFKGKDSDPSAVNWGSSGWGQTGSSAFPQNFSSNLTNTTASRAGNLSSNSLLQFSRSLSSHSGVSSQSSDTIQQYQQQLKLLGSGQSSPRSGLLSNQQQQQQQLSQQQFQQQQQQQRGTIGQLPNLSMQGHSSPPSHSPGPAGSKILPNRSLPPSSSMLPTSSAALSNVSNFQSFIGGRSGMPQNLLNSVMHSANSDMSSTNATGVLGPPGSGMNAFDSDFPALANRVGNSQSSRPGQNSFSFVMSTGKNTLDSNQEFQMQNEDFPALPGSNPAQMQVDGTMSSPAGLGALGQLQQSQPPQIPTSSTDVKENPLGDTYSLGSSYEQILKDGKFITEKKPRTPVSAIQTNSSGVITNIPSGMVTDQFGMIGLLTFIRAAETEPELVTLALGSDLTTLGLNLNSTESLYHTFGSPFSDTTCNPHEIDFYAPSEYLISTYVRESIAPVKLGRYGEDLLFYLYYTNSGEMLQIAAATELFCRDWRFHKDERVWITRFPGVDLQMKMSTYERGTYYYFDPQGWRKVAKEFHVEYDRLEEKPSLAPQRQPPPPPQQ